MSAAAEGRARARNPPASCPAQSHAHNTHSHTTHPSLLLPHSFNGFDLPGKLYLHTDGSVTRVSGRALTNVP